LIWFISEQPPVARAANCVLWVTAPVYYLELVEQHHGYIGGSIRLGKHRG